MVHILLYDPSWMSWNNCGFFFCVCVFAMQNIIFKKIPTLRIKYYFYFSDQPTLFFFFLFFSAVFPVDQKINLVLLHKHNCFLLLRLLRNLYIYILTFYNGWQMKCIHSIMQTKLTVMYLQFVILAPLSTFVKCHITRASAHETIVGVNKARMTALTRWFAWRMIVRVT